MKTVDRAIENFNFSIERITRIPLRRNTTENIETSQIYDKFFYSFLAQRDRDNFVFLDEV